MPFTDLNDIFPDATVIGGDITIPSGDLVSCQAPSLNDPEEIVFGMLETIHQGIVSANPTNIRTSSNSTLINADTYRRTYSFTVDLQFNNSVILSQLDVKPEPNP